MLMRTDPLSELDRLSERSRATTGRPAVMPMDAYRAGDHFVVHFDLPGVDPESIDVTLEQNVLTVSAERIWEPTDGQQVVAWERPQGRFRRQLFLGEGLDTEKLEASYNQGVLTLRIPVAEPAKPRKVQISSGKGQAIDATSSRS